MSTQTKSSSLRNINYLVVGPEASTLLIPKPLTSGEAVPVHKHQATKVTEGVEENFDVFLTSTTDTDEWFTSCSSPLPLEKKPSVPTG